MPPKFSNELIQKIIFPEWRDDAPRTSPCEANCPAGNPIQKINALIREERVEEALTFLRSRNPFAGITGRVCAHPCEGVCSRNEHDEGLAIRALERFAADHVDAASVRQPQRAENTGKKVAIIGSGPAGMTCAYFSALLGHAVTVFESSTSLGGIPRTAIPDFWLPKDIVEREIAQILDLGVRAKTSTAVGRDIAFNKILKEYDACLIAVGASKERSLDVPGAEMIVPAISFLKGVNLGQRDSIGDRVVIVGGGGVAFDCAFTAKRLGAAEVHIVCVEGQDCMCAPPPEISKADAEGIVVHNSKMISNVLSKGGKTTGIEYYEISAFEFDEECRLSVQPVSGEKKCLEADFVISAVGGNPDLSFIGDNVKFELASNGTLKVNPQTMATSMDKVFASGDVVSGPASVAQAIGSGRYAAMAIDHYLNGSRLSEFGNVIINEEGKVVTEKTTAKFDPYVVSYDEILNVDYHEKKPRQTTTKLLAEVSVQSFEEMDKGLEKDRAMIEAERCLHCGHCTACGCCIEDCPGLILAMNSQGPQVVYPDECWHCGCCRIACPSGAVYYEFPLNMRV
ncbi:MAG: FAD-dependent oxidoreductase [Desulfobacterales bacterium]|jgi:NADPH-dependent glutamate synthase beta subunit-like oxidoreductase|nr:FAD-dependent oxidoreductase [Desulfobacterales bacterium]